MPYPTLHYTYYNYSRNYNYATLHYTTPEYTTLRYITLHQLNTTNATAITLH